MIFHKIQDQPGPGLPPCGGSVGKTVIPSFHRAYIINIFSFLISFL